MIIYAIDPGASMCGHVILDGGTLTVALQLNPSEMLGKIRSDAEEIAYKYDQKAVLAIEMISSQGMSVGQETFDTAMWVGRYCEVWDSCGMDATLAYRREIKLHLCGTSRAKDANVRQALIDRYGGKEAALGKKRFPGPLFGVSGHSWAALAVAVFCQDHLAGKVDTIRTKA